MKQRHVMVILLLAITKIKVIQLIEIVTSITKIEWWENKNNNHKIYSFNH